MLFTFYNPDKEDSKNNILLLGVLRQGDYIRYTDPQGNLVNTISQDRKDIRNRIFIPNEEFKINTYDCVYDKKNNINGKKKKNPPQGNQELVLFEDQVYEPLFLRLYLNNNIDILELFFRQINLDRYFRKIVISEINLDRRDQRRSDLVERIREYNQEKEKLNF